MCVNFRQCAFPLWKIATFNVIEFWTKSSIFNEILIKSIGLPLYKIDNFQRFLNKIHGFSFESNMCLNFRQRVFPLRKSATFCFDLNHKCTICGARRAQYHCKKCGKWACFDHIFVHWAVFLLPNFNFTRINSQTTISWILKWQAYLHNC